MAERLISRQLSYIVYGKGRVSFLSHPQGFCLPPIHDLVPIWITIISVYELILPHLLAANQEGRLRDKRSISIL